MITSDSQLETKPTSSDQETAMNSHDGVLDGGLARPERANVNAIREAIEAQDEMEVGKPIVEKQEEIKAEAKEEDTGGISVEKGKTQIIINIAGKKKTLSFSSKAAVAAFVKGAAAKFGDKFEVVAAPMPSVLHSAPVTSGISDIDGGAPTFKGASEYRHLGDDDGHETDISDEGYCTDCGKEHPSIKEDEKGIQECTNCRERKAKKQAGKDPKMNNEGYNEEAKNHPDFCECDGCAHNNAMDKEFSKEAGGMNFSPSNVPSQVLQEFYPEIQHETIEYPNATNAPMVNPDISGDMHSTPDYEEGMLPGAIEDVFSTMSRISYVSTSPAGGMGIGRDGKSQVLEGTPLRKELDIKGPMFMEEFYANTSGVPGAAISLAASKKAGVDDKQQFSIFLKRVMGEVAASFLAAFKVTTRMPMNKVPGVGEIQLAQVEQPTASAFNVVNTGSRVKYLMDKLTDSEIQTAINEAFAQAAVWHEAKEGGFVYEVFVRAETVDTESMLLKYKFVTGTKDAE